MANILDIFRTHTGGRLLAQSSKITELNEQELKRAYTLLLPSILAICQSKNEIEEITSQNLIEFIEEQDLVKEGKKVSDHLLNKEQINNLDNCNILIDLEKESFHNVILISTGIISVIINELVRTNDHTDFREVIGSLSGDNTKFDKSFINLLVKNSDDPNLIESSEEIALKPDKDDNDSSILGGYTGGR